MVNTLPSINKEPDRGPGVLAWSFEAKSVASKIEECFSGKQNVWLSFS